MNFLTKSTLMLASALAVGAVSADAKLNQHGRADLTKFAYHIDSHNAFSSNRDKNIRDINAMLDRAAGVTDRAKAAESDQAKPDIVFGPAHMTGDLDGPNGERWYYTVSYEYTEIPPDYDNYIWFTDYILQSWEYKIYDPDFKLVGTIKDKMHYAEDEVRVPSIELAPIVSRNFFNTDDKIEVIVSLAVNTTTPGSYRYRSLVYSIGGEKEDGDDKPITTYDTLLADVVEGPARADGKDNFYMSFAYDTYPEFPAEGESIWEYITGSNLNLVIYGSATDATGPRKLLEKEIPLANMPGDQESAAFMMSINHNDDIYFVCSHLEQPLWNRYDDPVDDEMTQREDNVLLVEFYKAENDKIEYKYTTKIKTERDLSSEQNLATFYSVGGLKYKEDVDFDHYGTPAGKAALIVTRENYNPGSDSTIPSYFVYNYTGRVRATLAENCAGNLSLSQLPGFDPQHVFIYSNGTSFMFSFVNLLTGKQDFYISSQYEIEEGEEPEGIRANLDRVAVGDSYQYAIELQAPLLTDDEDNVMRIMWIDKNGQFDRFEGVNMGKDVQYAQLYIDSAALDPTTFHSDANPEYLLLIKRGNPGSVLTEELMLAQTTDDEFNGGKTLLLLKPDAEKGNLTGIVPDLYGDDRNLTVYYSTGDGKSNLRYTQEIYKLPVDHASGIEGIATDNTGNRITVTGNTVAAEGTIHVYTSAGALVASGKERVNLTGMAPGIYIATASGASVKVAVK